MKIRHIVRIAGNTATALAIGAAALPADAAREKAAPVLVQEGFHRMTLGDFTIVVLSDGTVVRNAERLLTRIPNADVKALVSQDRRASAMELSINAFLVDTGHQRILVDTGAGDLFKPEAGLLVRNLEAAGYSPDRIDAIVLTHIHADHSGGLVHDGRKVFANATVHVPQPDFDLFMDSDAAGRAGPELKHVFEQARLCLGPYLDEGRLKTFEWNVELMPGVSTLPAPGHTPGHSIVVIESAGQRLKILGDTVHVAEVQFDRPEAAVTFDVDQAAAASQRRQAFEAAAASGDWVAFDHVSFPGIGHVRKSGDRFVWIPMPYAVQQ